ncbi:MAG: elongation factor P hydroxylase [Bermanella sp.]
MHSYTQLISIFNRCFKEDLQTELVRGGHEPIYIPASADYPWHRVVFAHGYFASALHEVSHWCIAGVERRQLLDFGYWYHPDGRNEQQQQAFAKVEVKPQALEWILSQSAHFKFGVSLDNLQADSVQQDSSAAIFKDEIYAQVQQYLLQGLPKRAKMFSDALIAKYRPQQPLDVREFNREEL